MKDAVAMITKWWEWYNSPFPDPSSPHTACNYLNYDTLEDPNEEFYKVHTPHLLHGFDKRGNPIYWEKTGLITHQMKPIKHTVGMDKMLIRHLRIQTFLELRLKYSEEQRGHSVDKFVVVFDFSHIKKIPDLYGVKFFKRVLQMDQDYYPERLASIIVINAPSFFASIYRLISPYIDPVTALKIKVLDHNYHETLQDLMDLSEIPPEYGGQAEDREWCWPYAESSGVSPAQLQAVVQAQAESVWRDTGEGDDSKGETNEGKEDVQIEGAVQEAEEAVATVDDSVVTDKELTDTGAEQEEISEATGVREEVFGVEKSAQDESPSDDDGIDGDVVKSF